MALVLILTGVVFALLIAEAGATRRSVDRISMRIQVNGTRGKSSTTGYIAAALRAEDKQVLGKITGEIPSLIGTDGTKTIIRRRGAPRIQEQFRVIRLAARSGIRALVLECMSIDPVLQETESRFFRPHIYVLTNIRDDHREKTGRTRGEQVAAMCRAIPKGCVLVTGDTENLEAIRDEADKKKCRLVVAGTLNEKSAKNKVPGMPPGIFRENIELAAETAVQAGMNWDQALTAILDSIPEMAENADGEPPVEKKIPFLNAFPVNDPESATLYLERWTGIPGTGKKLVLIFNTRSDRPSRTDLFSEWIRERGNLFAGICITGNHRARAYARLRDLRPGVEVLRIRPGKIASLPARLYREHGKGLVVMGIGNIKGAGYRVIKEFEQ
jgi:poly-gamma-glutamate synthase PgsB/CapB